MTMGGLLPGNHQGAEEAACCDAPRPPRPPRPVFGMSVLCADPVGHCSSSNKSVLWNDCVQSLFSQERLGLRTGPPSLQVLQLEGGAHG